MVALLPPFTLYTTCLWSPSGGPLLHMHTPRACVSSLHYDSFPCKPPLLLPLFVLWARENLLISHLLPCITSTWISLRIYYYSQQLLLLKQGTNASGSGTKWMKKLILLYIGSLFGNFMRRHGESDHGNGPHAKALVTQPK